MMADGNESPGMDVRGAVLRREMDRPEDPMLVYDISWDLESFPCELDRIKASWCGQRAEELGFDVSADFLSYSTTERSFMKSSIRILALGFVPLSLFFGTTSAKAGLYTLTVSNGGSGNTATDATATFNVTAGQVVITLTNNLPTNITNLSSAEAISGINFTLGGTSGSVSYSASGSSVAGQLANIDGTNLVTYESGDPLRWLGQGASGAKGTIPNVTGGDTVNVSALTGGQPTELITPNFANSTTYSNINNLSNFSPAVIYTLSLTLDLTGVLANTTVTSATVYFGTAPDSHLTGTPTAVPEPSTAVLLLTALAPIGLVRYVRRHGRRTTSLA